MAKQELISAPNPVKGHWYWKDETQTLEFQANISHSINEKDRKSRRSKNITFADAGKKDRATPVKIEKGQGAGGRGHRGLTNKSSVKGGAKETTVTLERIKDVTLACLNEVNFSTELFEMSLLSLEQFDGFLLGLLNYFASFFDKIALENKPKPMTTEPSQKEKKEMASIIGRMEATQKCLAQSYCVLVLGLGLQNHHHMACGGSRVSSTYRDRLMYESLYKFCVYVVWIAFRRKDYDVIHKEVGRILRSDVFNPALRVKNAPPEDDLAEQDKKLQTEIDYETWKKDILTPAEHRKLKPKRPAITSIINQRSPMLVSVLPTPKEESSWLFQSHRPNTSGNMNIQDHGEKIVFGTRLSKRVGILGEHLSGFNPNTLAAVGSEHDEEHEETESRRESIFGSSGSKSGTPANRGLSRQLTEVSHAVTDVFSDVDED
ncbi:protein phosphatase 1 regulatory subunit 36-like isoform X2 [Anneissia japonica]|uniref:protein phosphatase 1 regulatory subunit 36-like isoform X1 n=1 Tax=Anneissia japonica TaxID=1529436 RepID=UPI0014254D0F|nr:protein phosphatase 1 regulatory subunit 36-like isoform X1 [Anneissia japonica]XP_033127775.1 protein phosphatase 1 regulatory subunit 36-like isoform X2 [Anneissia japonica]